MKSSPIPYELQATVLAFKTICFLKDFDAWLQSTAAEQNVPVLWTEDPNMGKSLNKAKSICIGRHFLQVPLANACTQCL
jgi:hypothetical protein